jgi:hypothetical protein
VYRPPFPLLIQTNNRGRLLLGIISKIVQYNRRARVRLSISSLAVFLTTSIPLE